MSLLRHVADFGWATARRWAAMRTRTDELGRAVDGLVLALSSVGESDMDVAVEFIHCFINEMLVERRFAELNTILTSLDMDRLRAPMVCAFLYAASPSRENLNDWKQFAARARRSLRGMEGSIATDLLMLGME